MSVVVHPIPPLYAPDAAVLILGSFPSVKSREAAFFYHHPQNRFWRVIAAVTHQPVPQSIVEKRALILSNRLALWDSIGSCEIIGSQDSTIHNVVPNDIAGILAQTQITRIFCNGATAYRAYETYIQPKTGLQAVKLPSTSPANAAWSLERLISAWSQIMEPALP